MTASRELRRLRRLGREALTAYGLQNPHLTLLSNDHNTTFGVDLNGGSATGGERYVLRIERAGWGTVETVRSEMLWLAALRRDTDLIVPAVIPTQEGDLLTVAAVEGVPEARICVLFGWIAGDFVDAGLAPSHLERVGALMACLQLHGARYEPPPEFTRGRLYHLTTSANMASRTPNAGLVRRHMTDAGDQEEAIRLVSDVCSREDGARVERLIRRIEDAQLALGYGPDVFGLIHADLHQRNYLFRQGQVCAIDFDDCGYGHYLYDLAVTLSEVRWRANTPALRQGLLAGYRTVRALPAEHEDDLDTFIALRELQNLIWRLETRNHPAFRDSWKPVVQRMLQDMKEAGFRAR